MALYNVKARRGSVGQLETTSKDVVKRASSSYEWAVGKQLATVSEWCHRKHMTLERITERSEQGVALCNLYPQGELV